MEYLVGLTCWNNVLKSNCLISREAVKDRLLAGYWIWKIPGPGTSRITYFAWQLIVFIHTWLKENKRATENQLTSAALVRTRVRQEHVVRLVQGHEGSLKSKIQLGLDTWSDGFELARTPFIKKKFNFFYFQTWPFVLFKIFM